MRLLANVYMGLNAKHFKHNCQLADTHVDCLICAPEPAGADLNGDNTHIFPKVITRSIESRAPACIAIKFTFQLGW